MMVSVFSFLFTREGSGRGRGRGRGLRGEGLLAFDLIQRYNAPHTHDGSGHGNLDASITRVHFRCLACDRYFFIFVLF
jgi:hypothetical protein